MELQREVTFSAWNSVCIRYLHSSEQNRRMSQKRQILMLDQQKSTYLLFKVYPWGVEYFSTLSLDRPRLNILYTYIVQLIGKANVSNAGFIIAILTHLLRKVMILSLLDNAYHDTLKKVL